MTRFIPLLIVCCLLGGCLDSAKIQEIKGHVADSNAVIQKIDLQISRVETAIADAPQGTFLGDMHDKIVDLKTERARFVNIVARFDAELKDAQNGEDFLIAGVNTLAPFAGPYGGLIAAGVPVILTLLRGRKKEKKLAEERDEETRKGHAAVQNINTLISGTGSGGPGKFDAKCVDTQVAMAELDREHGVTDFVAAALKR